MIMYKIQKTTREDVANLALVLRQSDKNEIWKRQPYTSPYYALYQSWGRSTECWSAYHNDNIIAIWGLRENNVLGTNAQIWLMCSDTFHLHYRAFWRTCKETIRDWKQRYYRLWNEIDSNHVSTKKWLRRLGFEIHSEKDGFHLFVWRR